MMRRQQAWRATDRPQTQESLLGDVGSAAAVMVSVTHSRQHTKQLAHSIVISHDQQVQLLGVEKLWQTDHSGLAGVESASHSGPGDRSHAPSSHTHLTRTDGKSLQSQQLRTINTCCQWCGMSDLMLIRFCSAGADLLHPFPCPSPPRASPPPPWQPPSPTRVARQDGRRGKSHSSLEQRKVSRKKQQQQQQWETVTPAVSRSLAVARTRSRGLSLCGRLEGRLGQVRLRHLI